MTTDIRSARGVHNRRAVGYLLMSALLPGSVQRFAGHRGVGVVATRIWGAVVVLVIGVAVAALIAPGPVVATLLTPWVATTAKVLAWVLFAGWLVLLFDSWRLARPMGMPRRTRLLMTIGVGVLGIAVGFATTFIANAFTAASNVGEVLPGGGDTEEKHGRYNVLLLGLDSADDRIGIRPDSINVASVDAETGQTVLFGLPRNMEKVPFPEDSPLHEIYPDGFSCPDSECMLNAVWTEGEAHADLFEDDEEAGLEATKDAVGATLGLEINYYALVDMHGFSAMIDALGGIEVDVLKRVSIGGGGSPVSGYIEPGADVHLDGQHALWFARSRHDSSDYERMQRQKCVMAAMMNQLDPQTVATKFVEMSEAGRDLLRTDVGRDQIVELVQLALQAREHEIASVNFTPPLVPETFDPDFDMIRATVQEYIEAAEGADESAPAPTDASSSPEGSPSASASSSPEETADPSASPTEDEGSEDPTIDEDPDAYASENDTADLASVCAAG